MVDEYEHEDYEVFHITKELKRLGLQLAPWDAKIGEILARQIRSTKEYATVAKSIQQVIEEARRENRSSIERKLPLLCRLEEEINRPQVKFDISLNVIAPSGVPFLYYNYPRMKILINPLELGLDDAKIEEEVRKNKKIIEYLFTLGISDEQEIHDLFHADLYFRFFAHTQNIEAGKFYTPLSLQRMSEAMRFATA